MMDTSLELDFGPAAQRGALDIGILAYRRQRSNILSRVQCSPFAAFVLEF